MYICKPYCAVAMILVIGMFVCMTKAVQDPKFDEFEATLSTELKEKYKGIVKERTNIYYKSLGLSFAFSAFVVNMSIKKGYDRKILFCIATSITLFLSAIIYKVHPKSDYMIVHLDKKEQREAWLRNYRAMQLNCHVGHLLGTIGVSLFLSSFCKK
tara:strand:+ start:215 stop:682 length:468 start_codon:yes stop_codon:yes gene_type:complete